MLQKDAETSARKAEAAHNRAQDIAAGMVQMNGHQLFLHEPWVFKMLLIEVLENILILDLLGCRSTTNTEEQTYDHPNP
ncbi:uncharacterized protein [Elaeis guineensis]|uniref:uncharacterized protein n=1 Tax=Elaeis guineensis var. tenera TaxID=51953 RepID=UPI003C6D2B88